MASEWCQLESIYQDLKNNWECVYILDFCTLCFCFPTKRGKCSLHTWLFYQAFYWFNLFKLKCQVGSFSGNERPSNTVTYVTIVQFWLSLSVTQQYGSREWSVAWHIARTGLRTCLQGGRVTLANGLTLDEGQRIARVYKQNFTGRVTLTGMLTREKVNPPTRVALAAL